MPRPRLEQWKPEYLDFIDLIRDYRRQELGKKGPIYIPRELVDAITDEPWMDMYQEQLEDDGVLGRVKGTELLSRVVPVEGGPDMVEFNCLMTVEEISAYKDSLRGVVSAQLPIIPATSWATITIRFITEQQVVVETPEAGQRITDFAALGFMDRRTGRPVSAWMFLFGLAQRGGEYEGPNPIPETVKQQKMALSVKLRRVFGLDTDPFEPYQERGTYRILLNLVPPNTEVSPYDEVSEYRNE